MQKKKKKKDKAQQHVLAADHGTEEAVKVLNPSGTALDLSSSLASYLNQGLSG